MMNDECLISAILCSKVPSAIRVIAIFPSDFLLVVLHLCHWLTICKHDLYAGFAFFKEFPFALGYLPGFLEALAECSAASIHRTCIGSVGHLHYLSLVILHCIHIVYSLLGIVLLRFFSFLCRCYYYYTAKILNLVLMQVYIVQKCTTFTIFNQIRY